MWLSRAVGIGGALPISSQKAHRPVCCRMTKWIPTMALRSYRRPMFTARRVRARRAADAPISPARAAAMVAARLARVRSGTPQPPRTTARLPCDSSRRREARERGQPPGRGPSFAGSRPISVLPPSPRPLPKRCGRVTGPLRPPRRLCPVGKRGKQGYYEHPAHGTLCLDAARDGARLPNRLGDHRRRLVVPWRPPHRDGAGRRGGMVGQLTPPHRRRVR
jgi:hypothetical protein